MLYTETLGFKLAQLVLASQACTIQLIPETGGDPIFSSVENGVTEIGISKKSYLAMFKQSHTYWHQRPESVSDLELYYFTFGYLLTTNENHTIIKLHQELFHRLLASGDISLQDEFRLIISLLTSRLKRINKSSSLWLWMKKLSIMHVFNGGGHDIQASFTQLIDCITKAQELHFANYYASNYLRWCIRLLRATNPNRTAPDTKLEYIKRKLVSLCHKDLVDVSVWSTLEVLINQDPKVEIEPELFVIQEFNRLCLGLNTDPISRVHQASTPSFTYTDDYSVHELHWLIGVKCKVVTPYITMFLERGHLLVSKTLQQIIQELNDLQLKSIDKESLIFQNTISFKVTLEKVMEKYQKLL